MSESGPPKPAVPRERLDSLDAFRGFVIASMLFVNMTWNERVFHAQFFHIDYNAPKQGATFTDLVFPWFLFIAGCAIPLSMRSGRGQSLTTTQKLASAIRRGGVIYLLGVLLTVAGSATSSPLTWKDLFGWNILQLIGVGYVCATAAYMLPRKAQIGFVAAVLILKLLSFTAIPADFLRSTMEAAGYEPRVSGDAKPIGTGTFTHFDDAKRFFHLKHIKRANAEADAGLWKTLAVYIVGWLGMAQQFLPCAAIAVMGGWCTEMLTNQAKSKPQRAAALAVFGAMVLATAILLQAGYHAEGGGWLGRFTVPFSKWLFSPSYCLLAVGSGALLLAGFYLVIDTAKLTRMTVFRVYGLNALALYVGAELSFKVVFSKWQIIHPNGYSGALAGGAIAWAREWSLRGGANEQVAEFIGAWAFVIAWLALWWVFCWMLWKRRIVIKV
jgi:predicted acyltransferase